MPSGQTLATDAVDINSSQPLLAGNESDTRWGQLKKFVADNSGKLGVTLSFVTLGLGFLTGRLAGNNAHTDENNPSSVPGNYTAVPHTGTMVPYSPPTTNAPSIFPAGSLEFSLLMALYNMAGQLVQERFDTLWSVNLPQALPLYGNDGALGPLNSGYNAMYYDAVNGRGLWPLAIMRNLSCPRDPHMIVDGVTVENMEQSMLHFNESLPYMSCYEDAETLRQAISDAAPGFNGTDPVTITSSQVGFLLKDMPMDNGTLFSGRLVFNATLRINGEEPMNSTSLLYGVLGAKEFAHLLSRFANHTNTTIRSSEFLSAVATSAASFFGGLRQFMGGNVAPANAPVMRH